MQVASAAPAAAAAAAGARTKGGWRRVRYLLFGHPGKRLEENAKRSVTSMVVSGRSAWGQQAIELANSPVMLVSLSIPVAPYN